MTGFPMTSSYGARQRKKKSKYIFPPTHLPCLFSGEQAEMVWTRIPHGAWQMGKGPSVPDAVPEHVRLVQGRPGRDEKVGFRTKGENHTSRVEAQVRFASFTL